MIYYKIYKDNKQELGMKISQEDIETIVKKTGCTREEAEKALEKHNGDIVDAVLEVERRKASGDAKIDELTEKIKSAVKKGNVNKIQVVKDEKIVLSIPVNLGILGVVAAPWAVIAGAVAAYGFDYDFEIVKEDGTTEKL